MEQATDIIILENDRAYPYYEITKQHFFLPKIHFASLVICDAKQLDMICSVDFLSFRTTSEALSEQREYNNCMV